MSAFSRPLRVVMREGNLAQQLEATIGDEIDLRLGASLDDDAAAPLLADADVVISSEFTREMADKAPNLKLVQCTGTGVNWIDMSALPPSVAVCNADGHEVGVTEYVIMTMIALNRDLLDMDRRLRNGDWLAHRSEPQRELRGRTLAILGMGLIGREIARVASVFGMRVTGVSRRPDPARASVLGLDALAGIDDLPSVVSNADFVIVAVPLNDETVGLLGVDELNAMKPTGYIINIARGPVIDEAALYEALNTRTIAGAAIDVWYQYPGEGEQDGVAPSQYPFHELDNVIMTPHVAGLTEGTIRKRLEQYRENLRRLARAEPLINVVKPASN